MLGSLVKVHCRRQNVYNCCGAGRLMVPERADGVGKYKCFQQLYAVLPQESP